MGLPAINKLTLESFKNIILDIIETVEFEDLDKDILKQKIIELNLDKV